MYSTTQHQSRRYTVAVVDASALPGFAKIALEIRFIEALESELGGPQAVVDAMTRAKEAPEPALHAPQARWLSAVDRAAEAALDGLQCTSTPRFEVRPA